MRELSNKTLALLLVFAIIFSLGGTLLTLNKIKKVGITGMVTNVTSGYVNASVESRVAANLTLKAVDFGIGYVTMGCNNCTLDTQGGSTPGGCCSDFSTAQRGIVIENSGNQVLKIEVNFSLNASDFIGGDTSINEFKMLVVQNESKSCKTLGATWSSTYANVPIYNTGETAGEVCDRLSPNLANDSIRLHINITIPDDASAGEKNASVIITGTGL